MNRLRRLFLRHVAAPARYSRLLLSRWRRTALLAAAAPTAQRHTTHARAEVVSVVLSLLRRRRRTCSAGGARAELVDGDLELGDDDLGHLDLARRAQPRLVEERDGEL